MARNFKDLTLQNTCGHYPETDEEKWNNPLDCFCEEDLTSCCRSCFEADHKTHKFTKNHYGESELKTHNEEATELMKLRKDQKVKEGKKP